MQFQALVKKKKRPMYMTPIHIHIQNLFGILVFKCSPHGLAKNRIQEKIIAQVRTDVNSKLGLSDLPNKNTGYPVNFEFLIDNKYFF